MRRTLGPAGGLSDAATTRMGIPAAADSALSLPHALPTRGPGVRPSGLCPRGEPVPHPEPEPEPDKRIIPGCPAGRSIHALGGTPQARVYAGPAGAHILLTTIPTSSMSLSLWRTCRGGKAPRKRQAPAGLTRRSGRPIRSACLRGMHCKKQHARPVPRTGHLDTCVLKRSSSTPVRGDAGVEPPRMATGAVRGSSGGRKVSAPVGKMA
jgi:hypothetical protein